MESLSQMESHLKKVLSGVRQHSPLLTFVELGLSPADVKKSIIELLSPYFTDQSVLEKFAVTVLPPEAVSVSKILPDSWAEEMFVTILADYRAALYINNHACLESSAEWETDIQHGISEYWSAFHLEIDKDKLSLEEFKYEAFRNIGMLVEASLQPLLKDLLHHVRIRRGQPTSFSDIKNMDLGLVVGELIDTSGYAELFSPPPWNIRLNQWRNLAQHHKTQVIGNKIIGSYGRSNNVAQVTLTRDDLFLALRRVFSIYSVIKTARTIFLIDNISDFSQKLSGIVDSLPRRKEEGILQVAASFATQGFELIDISTDEHVVAATVKDASGNFTSQRIIHSSQFVVPLWVEFPADESVIKLKDAAGHLILTATAKGKDCDDISREVVPFEELANRINLSLTEEGKSYLSGD